MVVLGGGRFLMSEEPLWDLTAETTQVSYPDFISSFLPPPLEKVPPYNLLLLLYDSRA